MRLTRTSFLRMLKITVAVLAVVLIVAYAAWRSLNYARGPAIILNEPADFATISATTTRVAGRVERAHNITLNGRAITIDEQGNFDETIVVFPGTNFLTLEARDQFGRVVKVVVRVTTKY